MRKTLLMVPLLVMTTLHAVHVSADPPPPPPNYPPDLDLTASAWQLQNHGATLYNDTGGGLYFDFPQMPDTTCKELGTCSTVNYLTTTHVPSTISGMLSITLRVETLTGTPIFNHTETDPNCTTPPSVRAFLEGDANHGDKRYWANPIYYTLAPGTVTMNVPLDPALWSDTYGAFANVNNRAINRWEAALDDLVRLGVTFGGGCAFGHGLFTTDGTARFTLENYEVMPIPPDCLSVSPCPGFTNDCTRGRETGATNAGINRCFQWDGSLLNCGSQSVYVITTTCQRAACCLTVPPTCLCLPSCGGGSYLECR